MAFSKRELQAIEAHPIQKKTRRRAKAITNLYLDAKPYRKEANRLILRDLVENNASKVILTTRRDRDLSTALFQLAQNFESLPLESTEDQLRPLLAALIFPRYTDQNIWQAVLDLVDAGRESRPRTFCSVPPAPATTSPKIVEHMSVSKFQPNVLRGVKNFVHNQFKTDDWHPCRKELVANVLKEHNGGRWVGFPEDIRKANVFEWLRKLQDDCFPGAPYTVSRKRFPDPFEPDERGNAGIFFDSSVTWPPCERTYQKVSVIADHRASYDKWNFKSMYQKLTHHVQKVFTEEPLRAFVHGFNSRRSPNN